MSTVRTRTASILTLGAGALVALAACADGPVAPAAPQAAPSVAPSVAPSLARGAEPTTPAPATTRVRGVLWSKPARLEISARLIGPEGGNLSLSGGVKLVVPRGAVSFPTAFVVTRLPGRLVAYDFQPHGIRFNVPVQFEHSTSGIDMKSVDGASQVEAAHFLDLTALDQLLGTAEATEFAPTIIATDKSKVTMAFPHFSGWMVSTGRKR